MTILGIDPGYGTIGYGVVRFDNMKFTPVQYGAAKTAPGLPMHLRLCEIYDDICTLVDTFHPDEVAIERAVLFQEHNDWYPGRAERAASSCLRLRRRGLNRFPIHPIKSKWQ